MREPPETWVEEAAEQDARLAEAGLDVWVGAEPTFTRRDSTEPWWTGEALGGDKLERAHRLLHALAPRLSPRTQCLRVVGRSYPGEPCRRFALGALWPRSDAPRGAAALAAVTAEPPRVKGGLWVASFLDPLPGEPPRVTPGDAYLTVTPDPGVVEVNMAPAADLQTFGAWTHAIYEAAAAAGLSPYRYRFNGDITDSGGGGQVTLGGPTPEASPFFTHPQTLPRLVRYFHHHPSLSYWLAPECVGSAGQGPRPDEGVRERFEELAVTLVRLAARGDALTREELGAALSPLLADASGNPHRAELNVEKLWTSGERGRLGLVEVRSLRMQPDPERAIAVAALLRALAARLALHPFEHPLQDLGAALHTRYALPGVLRADLQAVLEDLEAHGWGLGPCTRAALLTPPEPLAEVALGRARLVVTTAREFWPLIGDVASQEARGSRWVDSSTERLEIKVEGAAGTPGLVTAQGFRVPLEPHGSVWLAGVRRRIFTPLAGLHPGLAPQEPLVLRWWNAGEGRRVELFAWKPGGGPYPGLPGNAQEAAARRAERVRITVEREPPRAVEVSVSHATLDLRCVA